VPSRPPASYGTQTKRNVALQRWHREQPRRSSKRSETHRRAAVTRGDFKVVRSSASFLSVSRLFGDSSTKSPLHRVTTSHSLLSRAVSAFVCRLVLRLLLHRRHQHLPGASNFISGALRPFRYRTPTTLLKARCVGGVREAQLSNGQAPGRDAKGAGKRKTRHPGGVQDGDAKCSEQRYTLLDTPF
jgi:hypothetical protein